ncbi:DNA topoisomerase 3 [compost metagenome]
MRLFLCEKPSQARDIARVLGAHRRENGCLSGRDVTVTWCVGHLLEAAPPEAYDARYKQWSLEDLPIIPERWQVEIKARTADQFRVVKRLLAEAESLVIATDADREGELIAREILELCGYRGTVQRLWLSALDEASIRKALAALKPGEETYPLYLAALARSRADWLVGMNLSRLFTLLGRRGGYDGILSVGRVQTPTLRLVVDRDRAIASFVPTPYWQVDVRLKQDGQVFAAQWQPPEAALDQQGHCVDQNLAREVAQRLAQETSARVSAVDSERLQQPAPLPFDLSTLQELCSRQLGLGVQTTLDIAQSLYEQHKAITYPRTDCGYLPDSLRQEVPAVLAALRRNDATLAPLLDSLNINLRSRAWNDDKITAHHGIIPTVQSVDLTRMTTNEQAIYALICEHYLAQFLPAHEWLRTRIELYCAGQQLLAIGKQVLQTGWHRVLNDPEESDPDRPAEQSLPALEPGLLCCLSHTELTEQQTRPPKAFTEGDLLRAMKGVARLVEDPRLRRTLKESAGIGTEATRAGIIKGLIERGYLVKKQRSLMASATAHTLIEAVPAAIADPGTTAVWEQALDEIAAGRMSLEHFLMRQTSWIERWVKHNTQLQLLLPTDTGPACPRCASTTRRRRGRNGLFWSCSKYPACKGTLGMADTKPARRAPSRRRSQTTRTDR